MARFKVHLKRLMLEKSLNEERRITQNEVAEATGLSLPTIARWYKDDVQRIEPDTVAKLMEYFGCSYDDLVTFEAEG